MLDIFRSKLKKENEDLKKQLEEIKEENIGLKAYKTTSKKSINILEKEKEKLVSEHERLAGEIETLIVTKNVLQKRIEKLKNEHCNTIERKNKELEGQRVQYEKALKDIFDLKEDKKKLIEELKRKDETIEHYEGQIISYQRLLQNEGYIIYNPLEKQLEPIKRREKTFEEDLEKFQNYFKGQVENIQDKIEDEALYYQAERFIKTNPINVNTLEIDKNAIDIFRKLRGEMKNKKSKRFIKKYTNKMADSMEAIFKVITEQDDEITE